MGTLLAVEEELATQTEQLLPGRVLHYRGARLHPARSARWSVEGPSELVALVIDQQPLVVALDLQLGGQAYKAIDAVAPIMALEDAPAVVLVAPHTELVLLRYANDLGVFSVLPVSGRRKDARALADQVAMAAAWRLDSSSPDARPLQAQLDLGPRRATS